MGFQYPSRASPRLGGKAEWGRVAQGNKQTGQDRKHPQASCNKLKREKKNKKKKKKK
jgi:hypothetical protein